MLLRILFFLICVAMVGAGVFVLLNVVLYRFICWMLSSVSLRAAKCYLLNSREKTTRKKMNRAVKLELRVRMTVFFLFYVVLMLFALLVVRRNWTLGFMPYWAVKLGTIGGLILSCCLFYLKIAYEYMRPCWLKTVENKNVGKFEGICYNDFSFNLNEFRATGDQFPKVNWKYLFLRLASYAVFLPLERYK